MKDQYGIMCKVSGGVTGTREAPLKDEKGITTFSSLKKAQKHAEELSKKMNNQFSRCYFSYKAIKLT